MAKNPNDEVHIKGIDTYELILDGHFIPHKVDVFTINRKI